MEFGKGLHNDETLFNNTGTVNDLLGKGIYDDVIITNTTKILSLHELKQDFFKELCNESTNNGGKNGKMKSKINKRRTRMRGGSPHQDLFKYIKKFLNLRENVVCPLPNTVVQPVQPVQPSLEVNLETQQYTRYNNVTYESPGNIVASLVGQDQVALQNKIKDYNQNIMLKFGTTYASTVVDDMLSDSKNIEGLVPLNIFYEKHGKNGLRL